MISDIQNFISQHGYSFTPDLDANTPGKWVSVSDDTLKGAWIFNRHTLKDQTEVIIFTIYDYRKAESFTEKFSPREITDKERKAIDAKIQAHEQKAKEEKERKQAEARAYCALEWEKAIPLAGGTHPYLTRKGFAHGVNSWGLRVRDNFVGGVDLLIPMRDAEGEFWGYQTIRETGQKDFVLGQRIDAVFYALGGADNSRLYLCEGVATALSIAESLEYKYPVFAAFTASNLMKVAKSLRGKHERAAIVVCADNDKWKPDVGNTGVRCATDVVSALDGTTCAIPDFSRFDETTHPTDFNDLYQMAGGIEVRSQLEAVQVVRPHLLFPLGYNENNFYFTSSENPQIQKISEFTQTDFIKLRPLKHWMYKYGDIKGNVDWLMAKDDLVRESMKRGIFQADRVRGRGIYFEGEKLVVHLGDKLYFEGGETTDLADVESENIYDPKKAGEVPAARPVFKSKEAENLLSRFAWEHEFEHKLLMGWLFVAPLAGIMEWRPHISIQAPPGTGKTTVLQFIVEPCMKYFSAKRIEGVTEAGLRQTIKSDATPVFIDEVDALSMDQRGFSKLMTLFRVASSGGTVTRGTTGGRALNFEAKFSGLIAGVNMPPLEAPDRTRIAELELTKNRKEKSWEDFEREILRTFDEEWSAAFFWAVFDRARALLESYRLLRTVIGALTDARTGQQYGALLAGFWHWNHAEPISVEGAQEISRELLEWQKHRRGGEETFVSDADECFEHLLSLPIKTNEDRNIVTLSEIAESTDTLDVRNAALSGYGLKLVKGEGLFICHKHPQLKKHFLNTSWPDWTKSLKRIDGSKPSRVRMGLSSPRGLLLPFEVKADEF